MCANKQRMIVVLLVVAGLAANLHAQQRPEIKIKTTQVAENVYMLAGAGGNLGLLFARGSPKTGVAEVVDDGRANTRFVSEVRGPICRAKVGGWEAHDLQEM